MRVLIADSRAGVRFALRVALAQRPELEITGEVRDAGDLIAQAQASGLELAIIAWELPGMPTPELIHTLHQNSPRPRLVVLGSRAETREPALVAGADAFVCMCDPPDELMSCIDMFLEKQAPSMRE